MRSLNGLARDGHPHAQKRMIRVDGLACVEADHVIRSPRHHHPGIKKRPERLKVPHSQRSKNLFHSRAVEIVPGRLTVENNSQSLRPGDCLRVWKISVRYGKAPISN